MSRGLEVLALLVVGAALVVSELVMHPGTIVPGVVGVLLMVAALLWAMIDRYPSQPFVPSTDMLVLPILRLGGAIIAAAVVIAISARYLPRTSLYGRFVLSTADTRGPSFSPQTASAESISGPKELRVRFCGPPATRGLALYSQLFFRVFISE